VPLRAQMLKLAHTLRRAIDGGRFFHAVSDAKIAQ
jgi:hypothetical protein